MTLSEQLAEMSKRAKVVEDRVAAGQKEDREQLDAAIARAKSNAKARQEKAKARGVQIHDEVTTKWFKLQGQVHDQFDEMQRSFEEKKGEHDVKVALKRADRAEKYAAETIDFALYAIEEAEASVLTAISARHAAEKLAHPVA